MQVLFGSQAFTTVLVTYTCLPLRRDIVLVAVTWLSSKQRKAPEPPSRLALPSATLRLKSGVVFTFDHQLTFGASSDS